MNTILSLFIPDIKSKKRAVVVRHHVLLGYILIILAGIFTTYFITTAGILGYATDINIDTLLIDTNAKRAEIGLKPLVINNTLSNAAELKAQDMFEKDYWAHTSPTGKEPWDFIKGVGYDYLYAGENLAVDFAHSNSVVNAWYNSPSHRDNLLNANYTEIGFAVVNGELEGRETTLVVQMFGKPRLSAPQLAEATQSSQKVDMPDIGSSTLENTSEIEKELDFASPDVNDSSLQEPSIVITESNIINEEAFQPTVGRILNSSDVFNASRYMAIILGFFITGFFAIDGYFIRRYGTLRVSGHTILHIAILLLAVFALWYTSIGIVL